MARDLRRLLPDGHDSAAGFSAILRHPGRHIVRPLNHNMVDHAVCIAHDLMRESADDLIERRLDAGKFPFNHAFRSSILPNPFGIGDAAAQHQRLVTGCQRAVIAGIELFLRGLCGSGRSKGKRRTGGCKDQGFHGGDLNPAITKEKGRWIAPPALLLSG